MAIRSRLRLWTGLRPVTTRAVAIHELLLFKARAYGHVFQETGEYGLAAFW